MARNVWKEPRSDLTQLPVLDDDEFWKLNKRFSGTEEDTTTKEKKPCNRQSTTRSSLKKPGKS